MKRLAILLLLLLPSPLLADTVETYSASNQHPAGATDYYIDLQAFGMVTATGATQEEAEANCAAEVQSSIDRAQAFQRQTIRDQGFTVFPSELLAEAETFTFTQVGDGWRATCNWSRKWRYHFGMLDGSGAGGL